MIKVYALILVIGVVGGTGYMAYSEYQDMKERIATLRENNAKLETALETSEASIDNLQKTMESFAEANSRLQEQLQKAEAYGDELQAKLRRHNLTALALKKPGLLEGRMNDATANLWRDLEKDTGGDGDSPLPQWLLPSPETGNGSTDSDQSGEDASSTSNQTETSPTS